MSITYTSYTTQAKDEIAKRKAMALEIIGGKAESYAKQLCPVDTGNLRNSITHQRVGENTEAISSNVSYAPYVELGHHTSSGSFVAGKPYLRPAAEGHTAEYINIIETVMKNA